MDNYIIALVGFLGGLVALITPIIRLNSNITRLTTVVERLEQLVKEKTDKLDETAAILYNIREMTWPGGLCGGRNDPDVCG